MEYRNEWDDVENDSENNVVDVLPTTSYDNLEPDYNEDTNMLSLDTEETLSECGSRQHDAKQWTRQIENFNNDVQTKPVKIHKQHNFHSNNSLVAVVINFLDYPTSGVEKLNENHIKEIAYYDLQTMAKQSDLFVKLQNKYCPYNTCQRVCYCKTRGRKDFNNTKVATKVIDYNKKKLFKTLYLEYLAAPNIHLFVESDFVKSFLLNEISSKTCYLKDPSEIIVVNFPETKFLYTSMKTDVYYNRPRTPMQSALSICYGRALYLRTILTTGLSTQQNTKSAQQQHTMVKFNV